MRALVPWGLVCAFCTPLLGQAVDRSTPARDYQALPPYGPRELVSGSSSYVRVGWKQAPSVDTTGEQDFSVVSAPAGWSIEFPDLSPYKGHSWYKGPEPGVVVRVTPPAGAASSTDAPMSEDLVIQMKRNGVTLVQTVKFRQVEAYPTAREFSPLPHNPRLFWDNLKAYENRFVQFGTKYGTEAYCQKAGTWEGGTWYYDGGRVFFQWADYSRDRSWYSQADHALDVYKKYASDAKGALPGWRIFTEGLKQDYLRNQREASRELVLALAERAAYHSPSTPFSSIWSAAYIREMSYAVDSFIDAQELGAPAHPRLKPYVDLLVGYVRVMCVERTEPYVQPFMLALCGEALIKYHEKVKDPRIPATLAAIANFCMTQAWVHKDLSWWYESFPAGKTPADAPKVHRGMPDLNLLLVPIFSWLHRHTGDRAYLDVCDHAFAGATSAAWLGDGKHFSQNYRWSLDYVIPRKAIQDRPRASSPTSRRRPRGPAG